MIKTDLSYHAQLFHSDQVARELRPLQKTWAPLVSTLTSSMQTTNGTRHWNIWNSMQTRRTQTCCGDLCVSTTVWVSIWQQTARWLSKWQHMPWSCLRGHSRSMTSTFCVRRYCFAAQNSSMCSRVYFPFHFPAHYLVDRDSFELA